MTESKPEKMAKELKEQGGAFIVISGSIALIGPGSPFTISPRPTYSEADLREAVKQGLLSLTTWHISDHTGKSSPLEVYVIKK